ncbi:hypothetical protein ASG01_14755 [Chryseobacterium sp. Leaf180]|nr:hypothetical protein ASG01_14755 [Chryseobacterium sp. Leaf180]
MFGVSSEALRKNDSFSEGVSKESRSGVEECGIYLFFWLDPKEPKDLFLVHFALMQNEPKDQDLETFMLQIEALQKV